MRASIRAQHAAPLHVGSLWRRRGLAATYWADDFQDVALAKGDGGELLFLEHGAIVGHGDEFGVYAVVLEELEQWRGPLQVSGFAVDGEVNHGFSGFSQDAKISVDSW